MKFNNKILETYVEVLDQTEIRKPRPGETLHYLISKTDPTRPIIAPQHLYNPGESMSRHLLLNIIETSQAWAAICDPCMAELPVIREDSSENGRICFTYKLYCPFCHSVKPLTTRQFLTIQNADKKKAEQENLFYV